VNLRRADGVPLVIGHRGASAVEPENTVASFERAVADGADLVELDVLPGLLVGHSHGSGLTLETVLGILGRHDVGLHIDLKSPGFETEAVDAVSAHGLKDRALFSTAYVRSAARLAELTGDVAIGYPRDRYDMARLPWPRPLTRIGAAALRAAMPARIPPLLRAARANVLALHHTLCSRAAVDAAHRRGALVLAWTANDPPAILRLVAVGVDGIVTDDPRTARATLRSP
jgi:glycerophosphoryl diester phosphodiesterase